MAGIDFSLSLCVLNNKKTSFFGRMSITPRASFAKQLVIKTKWTIVL